MKVLQKNVPKLSYRQKHCFIIFDEISLQASLNYDNKAGFIAVFEDNRTSMIQKFADHALVFMIRGVVKKYKQPISNTFCKSTTVMT